MPTSNSIPRTTTLLWIAGLICSATTAVLAQTASLTTTFTNPPPAAGDAFGFAMAGVGADKVVIGAFFDDTGANDTGAAYLFSTSGALLTTFTNPTPAAIDYFGYSVAAVGNDLVIIGAVGDDLGPVNAGAAHLFSLDGMLLTTFTNPTPVDTDFFGVAVAGVGSDKVVIGAYFDGTGAPSTGAAYLFSTNGALLITITNPAPADGDLFGGAVSGFGTDRVLIGASADDAGAMDAGAAYLFSTNGTLLTTFTNPTPAVGDEFGIAVAAVGSDKVLIGADRDAAVAFNGGAAYLFSTNGTLLTTFTSPNPAAFDRFGNAVAAVGSDKVLIGSPSDNTGGQDVGAAYLFDLNGTLLTTIINPTPEGSDEFGSPVAVLGDNQILVGAYQDDLGETDSGAAYLFTLAPVGPRLTISPTPTNTVVVAWPAPSAGFQLQVNTNLATTNWVNVTDPFLVVGSENQLVVSPPTGQRFYRLLKP